MLITQGLGSDGGLVTQGFGFGLGEELLEEISEIEAARLSLLEKVANQLQHVIAIDPGLVTKSELWNTVDDYQNPLDSLRERIDSLEEILADLKREANLPCPDRDE